MALPAWTKVVLFITEPPVQLSQQKVILYEHTNVLPTALVNWRLRFAWAGIVLSRVLSAGLTALSPPMQVIWTCGKKQLTSHGRSADQRAWKGGFYLQDVIHFIIHRGNLVVAAGMPTDEEQANERTQLLLHVANDRRLSIIRQEDAYSVLSSHLSKEERALSSTPVGERLPYNDYTTIDWLHDLVRIQPLLQHKTDIA